MQVIGLQVLAKQDIPYECFKYEELLEDVRWGDSNDEMQAGIAAARTAAQLLQMNQNEVARDAAECAVRLNSKDGRIWSILGEAQLRLNDLEAAKESIGRAKTLNPEKAGLWLAEAAIAMREERPDDAIPLITRALQLDPNNADAYFDLGHARIMQGDSSGSGIIWKSHRSETRILGSNQ